jgi:hypothetical protein
MWAYLDVVEIEAETDKALCLRLKNGRSYWVPLSMFADPDDYKKGDKDCEIAILEWFVKKEGIPHAG